MFTSTLESDTAKFDHQIFEREIKAVIERSRLKLHSESPLKDFSADACKTFVVATTLRDGGSATRMRTYDSRKTFAFSGAIWEAARATSAAPTFFKSIVINQEIFGDGGVGWNNPAEEAIAEAHQIWPNRSIGCLVSLGTGLEDPIQLGDSKKTVARSLMKKGLPKQLFRIQVAEYCVACITSCERIHRRLAEEGEGYGIGGSYFRFNVPQGMSKIGLDEWEKIGDMITLTKNYMRADARTSKEAVAKVLLEPQYARK